MPYLTQAEVEAWVGGHDRFVELTDDDNDGNPDPAVVAQLLGDTDAEADGYFRAAGYAVPVTDLQIASVKQDLLYIANFKARTRGNRDASANDYQLYQDAKAKLLLVSQRKVLLDVPAGAVLLGSYAIDSEEPLFTRDSLKVY